MKDYSPVGDTDVDVVVGVEVSTRFVVAPGERNQLCWVWHTSRKRP